MDIVDRALSRLDSTEEEAFLVELLYGIAMGGRGEYVEAGKPEPDALRALRGVNEMALVAATQLRSLRSGDRAYPSSAFLKVLGEDAGNHGCEEALRFALKFALDGFPEPIHCSD